MAVVNVAVPFNLLSCFVCLFVRVFAFRAKKEGKERESERNKLCAWRHNMPPPLQVLP